MRNFHIFHAIVIKNVKLTVINFIICQIMYSIGGNCANYQFCDWCHCAQCIPIKPRKQKQFLKLDNAIWHLNNIIIHIYTHVCSCGMNTSVWVLF